MSSVDAESSEVRALARLGLTETARATVGIARVHRSVSGAVFGVLGATLGRPAHALQAIHDAASGAAYTSVIGVLDSAKGIASILPDAVPPLTETVYGSGVIGVLDGLIGDDLAAREPSLAPAMAARVRGVPVNLSSRSRTVGCSAGGLSVARAYPEGGGHLVVFVHGLMETEHAWRFGSRPSYGARLHADIGATEVAIRYNTGLPIAQNGRALSLLLDSLLSQWPAPVLRISLIGHSMGGLVVRSACHDGATRGAPWVGLVGETVSLGSPHLGAPLARGVHVATAALRVSPMTRPFGDLLGRRSAGVRDLFHGTVITTPGADTRDGFWQSRAGEDVPLLPTARHLYATASVTGDPHHPMGRVIGDGLVLIPSGRGGHRRRHIGFRVQDGMHLGKAHHFSLLNHDQIYRWLLAELRPRKQLTRRSG